MLKRKVFIVLLAVLIAFSGCQSSEKANQQQIGFLLKTLQNPFFVEMNDGIKDYTSEPSFMDRYTIDVKAGNAEGDVSTQEQVLRQWMARNYRVIIITPASSTALNKTLCEAKEKGIKVLVVDTELDDRSCRDAFVGSDNIYGGNLAGEYILEMLGDSEPKIIFFEGVLVSKSSNLAL